jgi:hypothetical protein
VEHDTTMRDDNVT